MYSVCRVERQPYGITTPRSTLISTVFPIKYSLLSEQFRTMNSFHNGNWFAAFFEFPGLQSPSFSVIPKVLLIPVYAFFRTFLDLYASFYLGLPIQHLF